MNNLKDGLTKLGQTIYYARNVQINLPGRCLYQTVC